MRFVSTRGKTSAENAAYAIAKGLAEDGGLFVPEGFPAIGDKIEKMIDMDYAERAALVIGSFLTEYDGKELLSACKRAYGQFEDGEVAPVVKATDSLFIMELFHGPTLAFKDVALTLLPYLLRKGSDISGIKEKILILVATSGDTGKAALEGFKNADGIKIMVFYPSEGVSDMQKLQMCTQEGENVNVVAVKGNFDDCQTAVKSIFADEKFCAELKENGVVLSSANSINFGRLVPQITYYFSAYADLLSSGEIKLGDEVNFVVPTGNFGNILAGYYAKRMGLPVGKLVCASNSNNVLTEFFADGTYNSNREFFKTASPSMDILVSSNLERLIFETSDRNAELTAERMAELKKSGVYSVTKEELSSLQKEFYADCADEEECEAEIGEFFDECGYVLDPHTAVAACVAEKYRRYSGDKRVTVALSTASPYKFPQTVLHAISGEKVSDAFKSAEKLYRETAYPVPNSITALKTKNKRFKSVADKAALKEVVKAFAVER